MRATSRHEASGDRPAFPDCSAGPSPGCATATRVSTTISVDEFAYSTYSVYTIQLYIYIIYMYRNIIYDIWYIHIYNISNIIIYIYIILHAPDKHMYVYTYILDTIYQIPCWNYCRALFVLGIGPSETNRLNIDCWAQQHKQVQCRAAIFVHQTK